MKMRWRPEFNTGINVIDEQHKKILNYINELECGNGQTDRQKIKKILDQLIEYTQSHFSFEESLQKEVNYQFHIPHKRVHDLFLKKIENYRLRFEEGEDIHRELHEILAKWLINHIQYDDSGYVEAVKQSLEHHGLVQPPAQKSGWLSRWFG